jgi:hypothetical protein
MVKAARDFLSQPTFTGSLDAIPVAAPLAILSAAMDKLQAQSSLKATDVFTAVQHAFSAADPKAVTQSTDYKTSVSNLKDSLLAIKRESPRSSPCNLPEC